MPEKDGIAAILLASGFSRRFGNENKLLVPFRGKPLARHTLELVCGFNCFNEVIFVTADERVAALAAGLPVTHIHNAAPEKGRRESVRLGVQAAGEAAYYFFFPCDQPLLDTETIAGIIAARQPGKIAQPRFRGETGGSPALFSSVFRNELLTLGENEKPNTIKARHPDALVMVETADLLVLTDIDTPEDRDIQ
jgi:molybdenum cofactor cytidylyltransferase